ncbi:hypothetical protein BD560DRAFT_416284 [Blakeslea trispora]|nr:hypothetical protein BD560DRAFT_416284 [Blakeslea trispora]
MRALPFEIIELISTYISVSDLLNVMLVSKPWHHSFYHFLFKLVSINNQEKINSIASAFEQQDLPGHLVRTLSLEDVELSQETLEQYIAIFPSIEKLTVLATKMNIPFFIKHYSLQTLVLDTQYLHQDITYLLKHSLSRLKLSNLKKQVTLNYLEAIHQACPQLTEVFLDCTYADPQTIFDMKLVPCHLHSFSLSCQSGASKWVFWLPYVALKYPYLRHLYFKHQGTSVSSIGPHNQTLAFCQMLARRCRHLLSIQWDGIAIHGDQADRLYQPSLLSLQVHENFSSTRSVLQVPKLALLITHLSLSQVASIETIELIGSHCPYLNQLEIQRAKDLDGLVQVILSHCSALNLLKLEHARLTASPSWLGEHRCLKRLVLEHCSFEQGLFESISIACTGLLHVEITACFQSDTRSRVQIDLSHRQLETLKVKALRTRRYYRGCRIKFFALNQHWYHMNKYVASDDTQLETALEFCPIHSDDVEQLTPLVTETPLKAWDIEHIKQHIVHKIEDVDSLYYSGLVSIRCFSVKHLFINNLFCSSLVC